MSRHTRYGPFFKTSQIYQREFRSLEHYKHQGIYKPSILKGLPGAPKVPQSYLKEPECS